ncbi:hypothetical protein GCM10027167_72290 [Nocardia heshunensis]
MGTLIASIAGAGGVAGAIGASAWWMHTDGPTRLCAGLVAVFHSSPDRRKDARAVLAATKRRGRP